MSETCLKQSDLVVSLHGGLGEMSHSLGSQNGCYQFYPTGKHVGALGKELEPQHTASCAALLPAHLQTSRQCHSINALTYQTSWIPMFQHSLICQLSQDMSLAGSVFLVVSWEDGPGAGHAYGGCGDGSFNPALWSLVLKTHSRDPPALLYPLLLLPGKSLPWLPGTG